MRRAKNRSLLPKIEPTYIPKHTAPWQNTDLVRCLLEACTSISVLLNSFSSLRMAACGELGIVNKTTLVHYVASGVVVSLLQGQANNEGSGANNGIVFMNRSV